MYNRKNWEIEENGKNIQYRENMGITERTEKRENIQKR